jgi:hypothetical protein
LARALPTLQNIEENKGIVIIPNPVENFLYLSFESKVAQSYTATIYSITGQLIKSEQIDAISDATHLNINTADLITGTYVVAVLNLSTKTMLSRQFIKI